MKLPKDWDKPSEGNSRLCGKFGYGNFEYSGFLPYRLFVPEAQGKLPLVVYLHGADAFGDDNESQLSMHDVGTTFAKDEWQEHDPCFILAPQCRPRDHWSARSSGGRVTALIEKLIREDQRIDERRIYLYGYSAGGIGAMRIAKERPDLFAAIAPICGATETDKLEVLEKIPMWLIHAVDDDIVRNVYRSESLLGSLLGSRQIYEALKDRAPDIHYTEYPEGYMKEKYGVHPHCTWVAFSEDENVKKWMFSITRGE